MQLWLTPHTKQSTDVSQLRSFLGLVNYCAKYIPNLSTTTSDENEVNLET